MRSESIDNTIEQVGNACCTGCAGCFSACPESAIGMVLSAEGFYRPILDDARCTECGMCVKHCPVLSWKPPLSPTPVVFAAWSTDEEVRLSSSSGGVFSELARAVIERGGAVAACAWSKDWVPEHVVVETWEDVTRLRGSKYIPSRMGGIVREVETLARDGREVLFCGTPCQVAALLLGLSVEARKNALLVDLICHSVPSLRAFSQYRDALFAEGLESYEFRAKTEGWATSSVRAISSSGRIYDVGVSKDLFQQAFQKYRVINMEACHDCRFTGGCRTGDITLGDFWGAPAEWCDKRGVSVVLASTPRGRDMVAALESKGLIETRASDFTIAAKGNPRLLSGLRPKPFLRSVFLRRLSEGASFMTLYRVFSPLLRVQLIARLLATSKGWRIIMNRARRLVPGIGH